MSPIQLVGPPGSVELLVVGSVWLIVPFLLAYWVFTDGNKRGEDQAEWWAVAVGGLGYLTFVGGFLAFAVYIWQRGDKAPRQATL